MAKVSGSYESVVRGVSEQVPQDRRSGQHAEQINIISDPVRGAARRHGSVMLDEFIHSPDTQYAAALVSTDRHRAITFYCDGQDYDLIVRTKAGTDPATFAWCFNRGSKKFIPIVLAVSDLVLQQLVSGGVSASANIGKYLLLAGNSIVPSFTSTKRWDSEANRQHSAVWIRGGAYARTFSATVTMANGQKYTGSYKTKTSSYPQLLDTTDLSPSDPEYQKKVNDRVNAYNSAATAWIGQAADDITPQNIAAKLASSLAAAGLSGVSVDSGTVVINNAQVASISSDDGGDDSLIHAVAQEVTAAELVSATHWVGKVVKVRPKRSSGDDAFYLEAVAKDQGASGWASVYWRECAGTITQPTASFVLATVVNGTLYMASTAAGLKGLTGVSDVPDLKPSGVGDDITAPVPYFLGKRIDYLGVFQDRLVIGCDAVLIYSRPGDYFNWFRQSVLTVLDDDPVEQFALGSEDDRITSSATYDRNEVYFGDRYWYSVSGLQPLTPKSNGVVKLREEPASNAVVPRASENLVFYCKHGGDKISGEKRTKLYQIQAGLLADSPEGNDISGQLDRYLDGDGLDILAFTSPSTVFLRTSASRYRLYTYAYLDAEQGGQRIFDAWSKWEWHEKTGALVAISRHGNDLLAYVIRSGAGSTWVACERFTLDSALSNRPYADSLRPLVAGGAGYFKPGTGLDDVGCVAIGKGVDRQFVGTPYRNVDDFLSAYGTANAWVGIGYTAALTPTNPYRKGYDGRSITSGRLTLSRVDVQVADTGGMLITVMSHGRSQVSREFNGRRLGDPSNMVGKQPIITTAVQGLIAREIRDCSYTLSSLRWLPMTVTGIDWTVSVVWRPQIMRLAQSADLLAASSSKA